MTIKRYRLILIRALNHHLAIIPLIKCSRLRDWLGISAKCCYSGHFRALIRHHRQVLAKSGYFHGRKSVRLYKNFSFAIIDCKSLQLSSSECRDNGNGNGKQTKARTRNKLEDAQAGFQAALLCSAPLSVPDTDVDVDLVLWNTKIRQQTSSTNWQSLCVMHCAVLVLPKSGTKIPLDKKHPHCRP